MRLLEEQKIEYDQLVERVKQGCAGSMGEFASNVARLVDETITKEFVKEKQEGKIKAELEIAENMILPRAEGTS